MSPRTRGWLPGGNTPRTGSGFRVTQRDQTIFTTGDLIARDDLQHPIALHEELDRIERHSDEARAQRQIDAMCAANSRPLTSAVLSIQPADRKAA